MTRLQATNSLGYGVQWLTKDGWEFWDDVVYKSISTAQKHETIVRLVFADEAHMETRVYEVLDMEKNDDIV